MYILKPQLPFSIMVIPLVHRDYLLSFLTFFAHKDAFILHISTKNQSRTNNWCKLSNIPVIAKCFNLFMN